jgi:hypothetical protein
MDKVSIQATRRRIDKAKQPYEVYDNKGRLKKVVNPCSPYGGSLVVEIIYSRNELSKNEAV